MILQYCVVQGPPLQAAQTMGETWRLSGALKNDWQWRTRACSNGRTAGKVRWYYPLPCPKELLAFPRVLCDCSFRATELGIQMPKPGSCAHLQLHQDQERRSGFSSCYSAKESQPPTGEGRLQVAVGKRVWLLGNNYNKKTPQLYQLYLSEAQSFYQN